MTRDTFSDSLRHAFALLRTQHRCVPVVLRVAAATREEPDPDWQPL
ncbi:MAG TPA: hypothetical protein VFN13_11750 [Rudaea sp.]|nr:hypothetical protein [Rudaea sp.]